MTTKAKQPTKTTNARQAKGSRPKTPPAEDAPKPKKPRVNLWKVQPDTPDAPKPHTPAEPKKKPDAKTTPGKKGLSAIDAAATVLGTATAPMNAKELIEAMASQGLWASPGGKTPHATLYSAILREITVKGAQSRFQKTDRGRFALTGTIPAAAAPPAKRKGKKQTSTPPADASPAPEATGDLFRI